MSAKNIHYALVIDKSGSMGVNREDTRMGINEQIQSLQDIARTYPEYNYTLSIYLFNDYYTPIVEMQDPSNVREFLPEDYSPSGMTALYDSMGKTAAAFEKTALPEDEVTIVTFTDGQENMSREYKLDSLRAMIERLQSERQFTFSFIGTNQDAIMTSHDLSIHAGNAATYSSAGVDTVSGNVNFGADVTATSGAFRMSSNAMYNRERTRAAGGATLDMATSYMSATTDALVNGGLDMPDPVDVDTDSKVDTE